jgi:hypothetical protein
VAPPDSSPSQVSTAPATYSSSSSIWSPVMLVVPPVRITAPQTSVRPSLSSGSRYEPVRTTARK